MATLREFFDTDFPHVLNIAQTVQLRTSTETTDIPVRVHLDFDANSKFVSCYLPSPVSAKPACSALLAKIGELMSSVSNSVEVHSSLPGEVPILSQDLRFCGRVFVYHEGEVAATAQDEIRSWGREHDIAVQFRGPEFAAQRTRLERPLAFISHDSRDKDEVARPVAIGLSKLMCPVWFDEFSLRVGDRLRESIERGLRETRKCILVLSPHFLANTGWTKAEFNGIFTRELVEQHDVVLPIWHGVTAADVYAYSATLADRVAVPWDLGVDEVVRRLHRSIGQR